jgi:antitoxin (DNA-binding transcriptional repressor) of toxin-antitoxin stability system
MKVIPLDEAAENLSHYGRLCHEEPVIITVDGTPSFQLVPLNEDDDLIDRLLEHNPKFRQTLEARLKEPSISVKDANRLLR